MKKKEIEKESGKAGKRKSEKLNEEKITKKK